MADSTADQPPACYRCDDPLAGAHWIRLSAAHQGEHAEGYSDVERRVCLDCLAAMGLLEFSPTDRTRASRSRATHSTGADPTPDDATDDESSLSQYARLGPIRSFRGGD